MQETPRANRLSIGFFGARNAGKSSLINALTDQEVALVSDKAGTTTDPVFKAMELLPLGPVSLVDTAGLDDNEDELGELRVKKTEKIMSQVDIGLLLLSSEQFTDLFEPPNNANINVNTNINTSINTKKNQVSKFQAEVVWAKALLNNNTPVILVINKTDLLSSNFKENLEGFIPLLPTPLNSLPFVLTSSLKKDGISDLKTKIIDNAPKDYEIPSLISDLLPKDNNLVLLIAPQDLQAPKGRLILPQVQVIRDLLDHNNMVIISKETELEKSLDTLRYKPDLIICDSQIFSKIYKQVPKDIPITSFSIIMARAKGDLATLIDGAKTINSLKPKDTVLIAEACTHHALKNDIGREQLPKKLEQKVGGKLNFEITAGNDFPQDLSKYKLVIHCGACMLSRKAFLARLYACLKQNVPITNYGLCLAELNGILDEVTEIFKVK